jgi:hypothetical protein
MIILSNSFAAGIADKLGTNNEAVLIAVIFLFVGILLTSISLYYLKLARNSAYWENTNGEITRSDITTSTGKNGTQYKANIHYKYHVYGTEYISKRVFYGSNISTSSKKRAQKLIDKYPVGQKVNVFFDPMKNSRAVIEPGARWEIKFFVIFSALFIIIPLLLVSVNDIFRYIGELLNQ